MKSNAELKKDYKRMIDNFNEVEKNYQESLRNAPLVAEEIKLLLARLKILSMVKRIKKGSVTEYGALSFGIPASAQFEIVDDGVINVDIDFSSVNWEWENDDSVKADVDLDTVNDPGIAYWLWMNNNEHKGFTHRLNKDVVNFDMLKAILKQKYDIDFDLSCDEKTYSKKHMSGTDDIVSENRCIYYKVDSHMHISGNLKNLAYNQEQESKNPGKGK